MHLQCFVFSVSHSSQCESDGGDDQLKIDRNSCAQEVFKTACVKTFHSAEISTYNEMQYQFNNGPMVRLFEEHEKNHSTKTPELT